MQVKIPNEFVVFAREQVAAGHFASEEEAVATALRDYLEEVQALRAMLDPAIAAADRGELVDGETFMEELIADAEAMAAARSK